MNKNTHGLTAEQLSSGTPSDKKIVLKAFYKNDKASISPAKDMNGRYKGIQEDIPELEKYKMGYVPSITSRVKIYDGIEIDLNQDTWAKDWEWMKFCKEIAADYATGQATPGAYFYIFRPGLESSKKVSETEERVKLLNYVLEDSPENLYNRASILGIDMRSEVISEVKEFLIGLVNTEPSKIKKVYESKTFSLELLLMHALQKDVVVKKNGVYMFGEFLLGVDSAAVISFFANPKNTSATKTIESLTYGITKDKNPLAGESVNDTSTDLDDIDVVIDNENADILNKAKEISKKTTFKKTTKQKN